MNNNLLQHQCNSVPAAGHGIIQLLQERMSRRLKAGFVNRRFLTANT